MLAAMGLISYFFVRRGLSHEHVLVASDLTEETLPGGAKVRRGKTSEDSHHRHAIEIGEDGKAAPTARKGTGTRWRSSAKAPARRSASARRRDTSSLAPRSSAAADF